MQVYKCTRQINLVQLWAFILLYTSTNQNAQGLRLEIKRIEMYSYIYVVRIYDLLLACQHTATQRKDVEKSMYKIKQLKRLAYTRTNIHSRGVDCFDFIILKLLSTNYMYCKIHYDPCHKLAKRRKNNHVYLIMSCRSWRVLRPGEWVRYSLFSVQGEETTP